MTLEPNVNQVVVKLITTEKTESGIILPSDSNQENKTGEIMAIAETFFDSGRPFTFPFYVGDKVVFTTYSSPMIDPDNPTNKLYTLVYNEIKSKINN